MRTVTFVFAANSVQRWNRRISRVGKCVRHGQSPAHLRIRNLQNIKHWPKLKREAIERTEYRQRGKVALKSQQMESSGHTGYELVMAPCIFGDQEGEKHLKRMMDSPKSVDHVCKAAFVSSHQW